MRQSILFCNAALALLTLATADARAVTMAWSPVGNPGNAADPTTGYGAVGYSYSIGTYDVTNRQYAEFLNTKDPTGANKLGLWSFPPDPAYGGINRNAGNTNGNKYTLVSGAENHPVNDVTWYDAIRFANWMNNGQGNGDTESGAYTLLGGTPTPSNGLSITRNAGATVVLPSESEWYKAAYYDPRTTAQGGPPSDSHYWLYGTSSNTAPTSSSPTALPNHANYHTVNLTDVGAYSGTTSPYGAFDMAGNVFQWNEALIDGSYRGLRGGSFFLGDLNGLQSSSRFARDPGGVDFYIGFRVASIAGVPEPSSLVLAALGFIGLAAWGWRGRKTLGRSWPVDERVCREFH
jgi:formylglycine-generating enzyme